MNNIISLRCEWQKCPMLHVPNNNNCLLAISLFCLFAISKCRQSAGNKPDDDMCMRVCNHSTQLQCKCKGKDAGIHKSQRVKTLNCTSDCCSAPSVALWWGQPKLTFTSAKLYQRSTSGNTGTMAEHNPYTSIFDPPFSSLSHVWTYKKKFITKEWCSTKSYHTYQRVLQIVQYPNADFIHIYCRGWSYSTVSIL